MPELVWFELYPPHSLDLATVTAMLRPLASRPRLGWLRRMPQVVFECWSTAGTLHWLLGVEPLLASHVPAQFHAQMPQLGVVRRPEPQRPAVAVAVELRLQGMANPLRLDIAPAVSAAVLGTLDTLRKDECAVVQWVVGPAQNRRTRPVELSVSEALGIKPIHEETAQDRQFWKNKIVEPLFGVRGRVGVTGSSTRTTDILRSLTSSLAIANASHAELRASQPSARNARRLMRVSQPGITWGCVINAAELATLLGWPLGADVPGILGKHIAPVPRKLLVSSDVDTTDRILGASLHPADGGKLVRVPVGTSKHHLHIIGPTGAGKSTLLTELARADMTAGRALFVMEPRGDLTNDILSVVPEHRRDDVVVIEPGAARSVGINPLRGVKAEAERRADQLVNLFEAWFGSNIGPRSRDVLLHCLIALARLPDGTLADVPSILTNVRFRRDILAKVNDPLVLAPFFAWYEATSEAERSQITAPVLNKTRSILSPSATRRLLGQAEPKFDLEDLFKRRRIVLVNLNAGVLGPDNASFIGGILLTQLWAALQRRATIAPEKRHTTMFIIDELPSYLKLPVDFGDVLAQSRGLGGAWTLAHQHLDQLSTSLQSNILTNARSRVVFRPLKDLKSLATALGGGLTGDDLEKLQAFEACARLLVDGTLRSPFSVRTRAIGQNVSDPDELRSRSQQRYGVDGTELDALLAERWQGSFNQPEAPIGVKRRRAQP